MRVTPADRDKLAKIKWTIENQFSHDFTTEQLAQQVFMSRSRLVKLYRACFGMAIFEHLQRCRLHAGKILLEEGNLPIKTIAVKCGYKHACNFSTAFKKRYGISPLCYAGI